MDAGPGGLVCHESLSGSSTSVLCWGEGRDRDDGDGDDG